MNERGEEKEVRRAIERKEKWVKTERGQIGLCETSKLSYDKAADDFASFIRSWAIENSGRGKTQQVYNT